MLNDLTTPFHDWLVRLRRHFHQVPELAYHEEKTSAKIAEVLDELGVSCRTGVGGTGIVAELEARRPGPVIAMRADMDALPIEEANEGIDYRSKHPGVMHACGHDGHMTIALGVIRQLIEDAWPEKGAGRILFIFQPAEEGGAGAKRMLESGVLDDEPVEAVFAGHMHPEAAAGDIGLVPGPVNAASDNVIFRIKGKGGHGAHPHLCVDPIVAGAHLLTQIQSLISRDVPAGDPAVLTIGKFHAGTARNIIPEEAVLEGTLRTLKDETRRLVLHRIEELLKGLEAGFRVAVDFRIVSGYPLVVNDEILTMHVMDRAKELLGTGHVHRETPRMGAEDFAYFLQRWPGVLVRLGCHDPDKGYVSGLHSPHFNFDERALDVGVRLFAYLLGGYAESWPAR